MSQCGDVDVTSTHPEIPTEFDGNTGTAIPVANVLNVVGSGNIATSASGNTVTISQTGNKFIGLYVNGSSLSALADSSTYILTTVGGFTLSATGSLSTSYVVPVAGTLRRCTFLMRNVTPGSSETYDVNFRLNATTSYSIAGSTMKNDASINYVTNADMNVPLVLGDFFTFLFTTPAYASNPSQVSGTFYIEIQV